MIGCVYFSGGDGLFHASTERNTELEISIVGGTGGNFGIDIIGGIGEGYRVYFHLGAMQVRNSGTGRCLTLSGTTEAMQDMQLDFCVLWVALRCGHEAVDFEESGWFVNHTQMLRHPRSGLPEGVSGP